MSANLLRDTTRTRAVQDEWGLYDPQQAGMQAVMRVIEPKAAPAEQAATGPTLVEAPSPVVEARAPMREEPPAVAPPAPKRQGGALYTLEAPAHCPQCESEIRTLRVLRVLRTQVSFTSTLPRKGYVIVCPECDRLLSAELSGLV
jgi:hypothetical protein